jgi:hypothetical protein
VQGEFLNFSTTNRIVGINLIENLLFWTDNRNQPRKINVELSSTSAFEPGVIPQQEILLHSGTSNICCKI